MTHAVTNANIVEFITTDPLSVGFAAIRAAHPGSDAELVAAANNTSGPGAGTIGGDPISAQRLISLINNAEYQLLTTAQFNQLQPILDLGTIDVADTSLQGKLSNIFSSYASSLASVAATFTRPASPWEVYFGKGQAASGDLLDAARNSGPNAF